MRFFPTIPHRPRRRDQMACTFHFLPEYGTGRVPFGLERVYPQVVPPDRCAQWGCEKESPPLQPMSLHQLLRLSRKGGGRCPDPPVTGSQSSHGALGFTGMQIKCSSIQDFLHLPRRIFKNSFYFEVNFGFKQCGESITNPKAEFKSLKYYFSNIKIKTWNDIWVYVCLS